MLNRSTQIFLWFLRITVPFALVSMLVVPVVLTPPTEAVSAVKTYSPGTTLVVIGAGESQYTFVRLSNPTLLTVQLAPGTAPSVSESRVGMLPWLAFIAILAFLSWRLWGRGRTPPNNSFKPNPLRGSAQLRR